MRLIDADKALRHLPNNLPYKASVRRVLMQEEAVDAVPVVFCRDCEYSANAKWNKKGYRICPASHMEITDDDFCSYGERREAGNEQKESEA